MGGVIVIEEGSMVNSSYWKRMNEGTFSMLMIPATSSVARRGKVVEAVRLYLVNTSSVNAV